MCGMEKERKKTRELKKMKLHVFDIEMEVNVPVGEEQLYLEAAEKVNRKIYAYCDVFFRRQYVRIKCEKEILLIALLDFAVRGEVYNSSAPARGQWRAMAERVRRLWEGGINFFKRKEVCD
jgi:hypothetical protein